MVPIDHVVGLSVLLFAIGVLGVLVRRNLLVVMMSIELMLNAANLALVAFNRMVPGEAHAPAFDGHVFVLMVITVAAAEVAVGLGILVALFQQRESVDIEELRLLRW